MVHQAANEKGNTGHPFSFYPQTQLREALALFSGSFPYLCASKTARFFYRI
jgi:hypothetical protein